ncbi:conserved protein, unknown function [Hepatocystis sp. ex Piliocolobus tephrosceles]|nr:conserved protein, unknown function [Hepatocystis sp. ex Piliocolobus tephrosceles]
MVRRKSNKNVKSLEKCLRGRGGRVKTLYEKDDNDQIKNMIESKIKFLWDYIMNIDNIVSDDTMIEKEMKKKNMKDLKQSNYYDEILYYNKNLNNLINIQKIQKTLLYFNINIDIDDIIYMFLYFTNNKYFHDTIQNKLYCCDYIDKKKNDNKFKSININNLYLNYEMFRCIFLNIDLHIENNGNVW